MSAATAYPTKIYNLLKSRKALWQGLCGAFSVFGDGDFIAEVHRKFSYVTEILQLATNGKL